MINLNIKNEEEKVVAEYLLKPNDRIDNLTLGMLVNNEIDGVISVLPLQVENDRFFRYDITNKVNLKKYLGEAVKKEHILKAFYGIAQAIKASTEYMINWTSFSLDKHEIYIDEATGKVSLICIPLLTVINDGNTCNFFKNVLFSSQFDLDENGDYVGRLITFLNPKTYTLDKFIYELEELLEIEHQPELEEEPEEEEIDETAEILENVEESSESVEKEESTEKETEPADEEAEPVEEALETTDEEAEPVEKETESVEKETESTEKESEPTEKESEPTEEVEEKNDIEANIPEEIPMEDRPVIKPFLIKVSNNQKIEVDKDIFYIGKDEKNVDYCIAGNSAVDEKHAYIVRHGKEYFVVDNGSKNHTYMNRVLIQSDEEIFLPHGAHLRFADEDFEFKMHK